MDNTASTEAPWRVGILFSQTGVTAGIERTQMQGTLLAIEEINAAGGVLGREIEAVAYDPASDSAQFGAFAERLLAEDRVGVIFGCYMSSTRKAVLPVVERRNGLLLYPTLYEGFECSRNVIYTGAAPNQNGEQLADYLTSSYGNRFYFVGSNYIYPFESNRIMRDLVQQRAGKVLGERYVSLDATRKSFAAIIRDIRRKEPDVVFSTVVGSGTAHLYQAYADAGFDPRGMPIASLTTSEAEIAEIGAEAARGHVTAAPYFASLDTPANRRFVAAYQARFGADQTTNASCEAAYFQVHLFARALAVAGSMDTDLLRSAMLGLEYDAPQGRVRVDPDNNHTYLWPKVGRVGEAGRFEVVAQSLIAVKPEPYLVDHSIADWSRRQLQSAAM
ncbi:transporter substrate-binding domain-containing protein [Arenibaculum sp.]|jgi:branched-chain amino acid transport system substrate-binding protein|uniref:transporter substrate-binding domain-containing protein n=1 Tax=Arenibaculum sp. TaxID=2865862 RepID=UPI002E167673|nr:transporter substrate-binding domain-containing protein [Arenibaculum sp.]